MNAKHAVVALALAGASSWTTATVFAQAPGSGGLLSRIRGKVDPAPAQPGMSPAVGNGAPSPFGSAADGTTGGGATRDPKVFPASASLPTPAAPDQLKPATIALPDGPVEPYLLTKNVGPFMVMAKSFRGPDAERYALALVLELRNAYQLPAYIMRTKDFPNRSMIRNVPPTAPTGVQRSELSPPEKYRSFDEAAVLVGDEKTMADARKLLQKVKKIKPDCLNGMPHLFQWREGLDKALVTINPFVPAQNFYSGRRDPLVVQMNEGPRTVLHAPGRFALEVANFSGRSTFNVEGGKLMSLDVLKRSPLATAHDDAEKLAEALVKTPEIRSLGQPVYVYHDRESSRVFVGSFQSDNDPRAAQVREFLVRNAVVMMDHEADRKRNVPSRKFGVDKMIVPANYLTDIDPFREKAGLINVPPLAQNR
ncbi:MAG: hypothetical protein P4L84_02665 [Isosphaeraceae bacterium]|nr:hypothetical protein [Isosphaeraceae bacterium]